MSAVDPARRERTLAWIEQQRKRELEIADAVVARFDWDGCEGCRHYPPERGGCDLNAPGDLSNFQFSVYDDEALVCRLFERRVPAEASGSRAPDAASGGSNPQPAPGPSATEGSESERA